MQPTFEIVGAERGKNGLPIVAISEDNVTATTYEPVTVGGRDSTVVTRQIEKQVQVRDPTTGTIRDATLVGSMKITFSPRKFDTF